MLRTGHRPIGKRWGNRKTAPHSQSQVRTYLHCCTNPTSSGSMDARSQLYFSDASAAFLLSDQRRKVKPQAWCQSCLSRSFQGFSGWIVLSGSTVHAMGAVRCHVRWLKERPVCGAEILWEHVLSAANLGGV